MSGNRRLLALTALSATLLTACGIRATEVPTDFGPAPSRVHCSLSGPTTPTPTEQGVPVQVFLLCGTQLVAVDRTVQVPAGRADSARGLLLAQRLLDELEETPSTAEAEAGYATEVRGAMGVTGPYTDDPGGTLRLSTPPAELTSRELAQIVCTLSGSTAAGGDGSVLLGGPTPAPPRRYTCTDEVRARPDAGPPPATNSPSP